VLQSSTDLYLDRLAANSGNYVNCSVAMAGMFPAIDDGYSIQCVTQRIYDVFLRLYVWHD